MKKNKNPSILSAESLVSMAKESHQKVMDTAAKREIEHKKRVVSLTEKERILKKKIEAGKKQFEAMADEFDVLEKEQKEAISTEIQESEFTKKDVQSGKITLAQFQARGKQDDDIQETVMTKTQEDLEKASDSIRGKAEEIIRLELELFSTQSSIHGLLTSPVKSLWLSYKELESMLSFQLEGLSKDGHVAHTMKIQAQEKLMLIEKGVGLSAGFTWSNISLKKAYRLRLDPVMPKKHIALLLKQLSEIEGTDRTRLTIGYHQPGSYWPGDPVSVRIEVE